MEDFTSSSDSLQQTYDKAKQNEWIKKLKDKISAEPMQKTIGHYSVGEIFPCLLFR